MTREAVEQQLMPALQVSGRALERYSLEERMQRYQVPGAAVAVVERGEIAWAAEYGHITAGGAAITPSTLFQAASISKAVAASGVLVLVERGVLDLDVDVNRLLRSWRLPASEHTASRPVTLRHLLSHTAGTTVPGFPGYPREQPLPTVPQILCGDGPANTPAVESFAAPGTVSQYSGGGSTIVQQLVCDVTGVPFAELMQELVLGPLDMHDSAFDQPPTVERTSRVAHGHGPDGRPVPGGFHVYPELQAAGLWTTASDLARWLAGMQRALVGDAGSVLRRATVLRMVEEVAPGPFGLGPELGGAGPSRRFGHSGSNAGFRCLLDGLVDGTSGMVMMTNGDGGTTLCGEFRRAVAAVYGWGEVDVTRIDVVDLDPTVVQSYVGRYEGPFGLPMRLEFADGELYSPAPYGRRRMFALGPTTFLDEETGATIEVERAGTRVRRLAVLVGGKELMAFVPKGDE